MRNKVVLKSIRNPIKSEPLSAALKKSEAKSVVIVVSDITRLIPYASFLDVILKEIEGAGVLRNNIVILIATGMHRPSTTSEREYMFGKNICEEYRIIDHEAEKEDNLVTIEGTSYAGRTIELNRHFIEADFRIVTGLVEPHFMAGFSGGRKSICPGLCSLETVKAFHSFSFLDNPNSRNANLIDNPLHSEAISIARKIEVGFSINLILNKEHKVIDAIAGDIEESHKLACKVVSENACPKVEKEQDVVITSSGGYPLDATFYQCVKGMVSSLPVVKKNGTVVSFGSCLEGIGGDEYKRTMEKYSGNWKDFLCDSKNRNNVIKDQWQFQMQTKVLEHVSEDNLIFVTDGISNSELNKLSVNGVFAAKDQIQEKIQKIVDTFVKEGKTLAVIPEGPYCSPIKQGNHTYF
ncbi:MAG: nickel-dependent lactate racemase [Flavobacteriaceae bacterium]|nr:nickel-dependent lactate racemase [Flavobacteriaceae bacterium]